MTETPQDGDGSGAPAEQPPHPAYGPTQPAYGPQAPSGPPPGYGPTPGYGPPSYGPPPGYGAAPAYGPPAYGRPAFGPPAYGPPGYGPPQFPFPGQVYGPPLPPPRRKRRLGLLLGLLLLAVVVVAGVAVAFLVGPTVLNRTAVERDVAAQFEEIEGVPVELDCPSRMTVEAGASYTCTGTTAQGERVKLAIHIQHAGSRPTYVWSEP